MTAHAMKGDKEKCLAAGMDHYITKPVNPTELYVAIENFFPALKNKALWLSNFFIKMYIDKDLKGFDRFKYWLKAKMYIGVGKSLLLWFLAISFVPLASVSFF